MNIRKYGDDQLVAALQKGEATAMTEIYDRYWRKLLAIAYNHTKDKSTSQEIVQEVMIKLWDRREDVRIDSLPNYLAMAVKYSVINYAVRERRRSEIAFKVISQADTYFDDENIYAQFLQEYISGVVETLPEKCKLVFKSSRENGKTARQIALDMDISEKTVEAHLSKALKSIRYSLRNAGVISLTVFVSLWTGYNG
ncbi:RNA polymerase sigma-70 factor [Mucilaginibacter mali]|uniref:RNA polymerase sigma-70 factor n=1 Tax=Mucilaginibacter mali TaxID=2740462 RepID=A0A7D4QX03_9SPHI|nr:RNA polymerase sigma-70 factor [Mucilaginibacter mali]QKJ32609.1 RNA polymerase sigma-70 factor [Mucilaginibacter mali]